VVDSRTSTRLELIEKAGVAVVQVDAVAFEPRLQQVQPGDLHVHDDASSRRFSPERL
jgi:hypothetical protein